MEHIEDWEKDFEWLRIRHYVAKSMGKESLPDLQSILFLIGIQEYGTMQTDGFTKEEKQDLMHIAVCTLLEPDGYFEFEGRDQDGWPHWKAVKPFSTKGVTEQENMLIRRVISYFNALEQLSAEKNTLID